MDAQQFAVISKTDKDLNVCFISWALVAAKPDILKHPRIVRLFITAMSLLQERTNRGNYTDGDGSKTPAVKIIMRLRGGVRTMCYADQKAAMTAASGLLITYDDDDAVKAVIELNHNRLNRIAVKEDRKGYGHDIVKVWMEYTNANAKGFLKAGIDACVPAVATADHSIVPFFAKLGFVPLSTVSPPDMPVATGLDTPMVHPGTAHGLTASDAGYKAYMVQHMDAWNQYWANLSLNHLEDVGVDFN